MAAGQEAVMTCALEMSLITKRFPGVTALDSVDFSTHSGEVVALIGENGAGKSTLMKILAGIHQPDAGTIHLNGKPVVVRSPRESSCLGIAIIHQELEVIDTLDIAANIFLGREPTWGGRAKLLDRRRIYAEATRYLEPLGLNLSPRTLLGRLSTAQKQLVEIAKALSMDARVLIMDEPTSSLTLGEAERLFVIVRDLRSRGVSIIYVSHRLGEIEQLADRVVALRDGRNAGTLNRGEINAERMVQLMVGRALDAFQALPASVGQPPSLTVKDFRTSRYPQHSVSLVVRRGEILGLAGLIGAGRSELARALFGIDKAPSGTVSVEGRDVAVRSPRDAMRLGIFLVPEDRRTCGLITEMSVRENITLPSVSSYASAGWIRRDSERVAAHRACEDLKIKASSVELAAATLSGGNQQKIVLAKWLSLKPRVLLFDEPTRGIDVASKAEIYQLLRRLAGDGVAVLMISSDMEEILGICDRVAVMHEGRLTGTLDRSEFSREAIMRLAVA